MKYISTRGGADAVSFEAAVSTGYAPDGGLWVPQEVPPVSAEELASWATLSYAELATAVLTPFVGDEVEHLGDLLVSCLEGFPTDAVKVSRLASAGKNAYVAELYHGPTLCFKDLGLPFLVRTLAHFCEKRDRSKTLVVATSGDTGPAAVQAVRATASPSLRVLCFYPDGMISEFQRKQMTSVDAPTVRIARFDGGGDDMDVPIKRLALDAGVGHLVAGVNSYNVARPLAQMVHFFWIALRLGRPFDVVIPTGAMGNLVAATYAKLRGVPIGTIAVASNANDFSYRALVSGDCSKSRAMVKTLSDAINIQVPYNFERILYLNGLDAARAMRAVYNAGAYRLDDRERSKLAETYVAARVDDDRMLRALLDFVTPSFLPDPHTSVALAGAQDLGMLRADDDVDDDDEPVVVLATAHACKFEAAVSVAIGADEWDKRAADFPERVAATLRAAEREPIHFARLDDAETLSEAQARWFLLARDLVLQPDWTSRSSTLD